MLPVHYFIHDEVSQLAVHVFEVLHVSFALWRCCGVVAGFAVGSVTSSCGGTLNKQHHNRFRSATCAWFEFWARLRCLGLVTLTFWLFCAPVLPVWLAEGVRGSPAAGAPWEDLGGFLGRNVMPSFLLETAPLPAITNTCTLFLCNHPIQNQSISYKPTQHKDQPEQQPGINTHLPAGFRWWGED